MVTTFETLPPALVLLNELDSITDCLLAGGALPSLLFVAAALLSLVALFVKASLLALLLSGLLLSLCSSSARGLVVEEGSSGLMLLLVGSLCKNSNS